MFKHIFLKWYLATIAQRMKRRVRSLMVPLWRQGFVQTKFIHIFGTGMTLFTSLSVYAIILHDLKDVAWIQSEWSRI